jgi:hypothetical protein
MRINFQPLADVGVSLIPGYRAPERRLWCRGPNWWQITVLRGTRWCAALIVSWRHR